MLDQHQIYLKGNRYQPEGKGTIFHLYFPLIHDHIEESADEVLDSPEIVQGEGCILLVDDEKIIRTPIQELLTRREVDRSIFDKMPDENKNTISALDQHLTNIHSLR